MSKYLSDEAKETLNLLAKRINPQNIFWLSIGNYPCICNICGALFTHEKIMSYEFIFDDHGLMHLKERGLLAFL